MKEIMHEFTEKRIKEFASHDESKLMAQFRKFKEYNNWLLNRSFQLKY